MQAEFETNLKLGTKATIRSVHPLLQPITRVSDVVIEEVLSYQILTQFWWPLIGHVTPQLRPAQTKNLAQTPAGNQFKVSRKLIPLKKTSVGQNDKIMQSQEESCMLPFLMFPLPKNVDHRWSRS